jgi:hypothetical protein
MRLSYSFCLTGIKIDEHMMAPRNTLTSIAVENRLFLHYLNVIIKWIIRNVKISCATDTLTLAYLITY